MPEAISMFRRLGIQLGAIFWFALLAFGLLGLAVIHVLPWWMLGLVVVAGAAIGLVTYLPRWLLRHNNPAFSPKRTMLAHVAGGVLAAMGIAALPFVFMAWWISSGQTVVPLATLTNGKRTVVFQGMQHVGSADFYKSVVFDLEKALGEGYTLFYEGVESAPGRPELDKWFEETIVGTKKGLNEGYTQLADSCGLNFQLTFFEPLLKDKPIHPSKHVTADVTYLDLKNEFDRLMREDASFAQAMSTRTTRPQSEDDPFMSMLSTLGRATKDQKRLIGILCRGFIGVSSAADVNERDITKDRLILDFRNQALARLVAESPAEKIYITYGAAHFPGFLKDLQARDPAMKVQSLRWVRPMSLPDEPQAPAGYPVTR
jgi:hypothetical protein